MSTADTTQAVIFDVGHVLYDWDPRHLYGRHIDDPERLDWFLRHVVTREWHFQHDAGRPFADTSAELIARYPAEAGLIELWGPRFNDSIGEPVPGSHEIVRRLHARGVPLFAITNFSGEFWAAFRPHAPLFDLFRDIVVSGDERLVKPDPAIYRLARARFGCERALFIDDRADNAIAASSVPGWEGHQFTDAARLEAELAARGLL